MEKILDFIFLSWVVFEVLCYFIRAINVHYIVMRKGIVLYGGQVMTTMLVENYS